MPSDQVVFYDGTCGFCNRSVMFLLRRDQIGALRFAPLQGTTAQEMVPEAYRVNLDTVVYHRRGRLLSASTAVLTALRDCGGWWVVVATLLLATPRAVRDWFYRRVAANRHDLAGNSCGLPSMQERQRFLP